MPHIGQAAWSRLSTATSQPGSARSTDITFRFGAGAQNANVFIPFDAPYQHSMQAGRVCCPESKSGPSKMLPDTHQADQKRLGPRSNPPSPPMRIDFIGFSLILRLYPRRPFVLPSPAASSRAEGIPVQVHHLPRGKNRRTSFERSFAVQTQNGPRPSIRGRRPFRKPSGRQLGNVYSITGLCRDLQTGRGLRR